MAGKFALVALLALGACGTTGFGGPKIGVMKAGGVKTVKNGGCNAKTYSYLLGQPESAVQTISFDQPARITRLGDIASSDTNPDRITFTIDKLGNVVGVKCG